MPIIPGAVVVPANIDDLSVTLEGARTLAQMYWYDVAGGNWDRAIGSAAGFLVDTELPPAATLTDAFATPTAPAVGSFNMIYNGATWDMLREGNIAGSIFTDVTDRAARDLGKVDIALFDTQITAADATATPTTSPPVVSINMVYNGATWDMVREGAAGAGSVLTDVGDRAARDLGKVDIAVFDMAVTPADALATPSTGAPMVAFPMVYNGATWDMLMEGNTDGSIRSDVSDRAARDLGKVDIAVFDMAVTPADALATPSTGAPVVGFNMVYNGATWDMVREGSAGAGSVLTDIGDRAARDLGKVDIAVFDMAVTPADALATPSTGAPVVPFLMVYNGATWDMVREGTPAGSILVDVAGVVPTANVTASGALGALNDTLAIAADGAGGIAYEIDTGTLAGTVLFEATYDDTNWFAINAVADGQGTEIASVNAFGVRGQIIPRAYSQVRLRVNPYTSGTSNARLEKSTGASLVNTELPAAVTLVDAYATPTAPAVGAFGMVYNGATWDMMREGATAGSILADIPDRAARDLGKVDIAVFDTAITAADATATPTSSPPVVSIGMVYNGATWDMLREGTIAGSIIVDTELPAAAALTDAFANPTAPAVGAFLMGWDGTNSTWERVQVDPDSGHLEVVVASLPAVDTELPVAAALTDAFANPTVPGVGAFLMGWDNVNSSWERVRIDPDTGTLFVSVDITELPAAAGLTDNFATPTTTQIGAFGMIYDGATWDMMRGDAANGLLVNLGANNDVDTELAAAAALTDAFATPNTAPVGAFNMVYNGATWDFMREGAVAGSLLVDTELAAAAALTDNFATPNTAPVGAFGMVYDGATWDMMRGDATDGLLVNLGANNDVTVTGTVDITELPAAAALTDAFANPTVTQIGAFLMGYDAVAGNWERVQVDPDSGDLQVVVTSLPAVDTELPAAAGLTDDFATPTAPAVGAFGMYYDGATWDMMRGDATDGLLVNLGANNDVTTEMSAAAALTDAFANPTAGGVGAFGMGYDGADWERLRILQQPNAVGGRAPGNLAVGKTEGKATYRVAFKGLVAAGAGVAVKLIGSASEIVRVTKVMIAKPSVAQAPLRIVKTSTAAGVAASTTPAGIPLDSADDAATAVVTLYTAVPAGGVEVGTGSIFEADLAITDVVYETFGDEQNSQAVVLRGVTETIEIDLSAGATIDGYIEWTEE